ncbi:MAG: glycosyltransferase family 39 protein [Capnocytophaga sp.]|nr:glycosyltransferase family 39 protein [Capnocytophaga sp.]
MDVGSSSFIKRVFHYRYAIVVLIISNLALRLPVALYTNLGVDEVYYTLYARYLDWAYFDHPPMVGWLIWGTTLGGLLRDEFFVRLGALFVGSFNLLIIYHIGILIKNKTAGIIAALLLSASFYGSVITGVFILPDTPQSLCWLLAMFFFVKYIKFQRGSQLVYFGVAVGLALLSKYHAVFLWVGAALYILARDRSVLRKPQLYIGLIASVILLIPVLLWNHQSPYSGIAYHEARVSFGNYIPNFKHFFPEFFGQIFYNNPFNAALIFMSAVVLIRQKYYKTSRYTCFLLSVSLPLVVVVLIMAMYHRTLPHWTGPAYFGLILVTASVFATVRKTKATFFWRMLIGGQILFVSVIVIGLLQIRTGFLPLPIPSEQDRIGKQDFTLDMALWDEVSSGLTNEIPKESAVISYQWFPAAHFDYYFAQPNGSRLYVISDRNRQHQYLKINELRGPLPAHSDAYYLCTSRYYEEPSQELIGKFGAVSERKTLKISCGNRVRLQIYVWKLTDLQEALP